jgi:hypothetical protein
VSGTAPYYAEAFFPLPGRCFRLVSRGGEGGGPRTATRGLRIPNAARMT